MSGKAIASTNNLYQAQLEKYADLPVKGWCYKTSHPNEELELVVSIDGKDIRRIKTSQMREDVNKRHKITGKHGFVFMPPAMFYDGREHSMSIRDNYTNFMVFLDVDVTFKPEQRASLHQYAHLFGYEGEITDIKKTKLSCWLNDKVESRELCELALLVDGKEAAAQKIKTTHQKQKIEIAIPKEHQGKKPQAYDVWIKNVGVTLKNPHAPVPSKATAGKKDAPESKQEGYILGAKNREIKGWAWNPETPDVSVKVEIRLNDKKIGEVVAEDFRADIKKAGKGSGKYGFTYVVPPEVDAGDYKLSVNIGGTDITLARCPETLTVLPPRKAAKPTLVKKQNTKEGRLEKVRNFNLHGWAWDKENPDATQEIVIYVDGEILDVVKASSYRDDVKRAGKGTGKYGFKIPIPPYLLDGKTHKVTAKFKDTETPLPPEQSFCEDVTRPYAGLGGFNRWALISREIFQPYKENDERIFGYMDWYQTLLAKQYADRRQDHLISIVMPTYNRADIIRQAITSVLQQSYENWELIIVDDGSEDNTDLVVRSFRDKRIKYMPMKENGGVSKARNVGMKAAKGKFFAYLDTDNTWRDDFLLLTVNTLLDNEKFDSIYTALEATEIHDSPVRGKYEVKFIRYGMYHRSLLENRNYIDLNCYIHRRELYDHYGGFCEDMRRLVDWDLILRYTAHSAPYALPCILVDYYYGLVKNQITRTETSKDAERLYLERLSKDAFTVSELDTVGKYADEPQYKFFHNASAIKPKKSSGLGKLFGGSSQPQRFTSIVIASYEAAQYLDYCVASIYAFTEPGSFEVILVDNASSAPTISLLTKLEQKYKNLKVIYNQMNAGFTMASNQGIKAARAKSDIILLNNDAMVTKGWVTAMQDVLAEEENVGMVVPRQTLIPGTDTMNVHVPFCNPTREIDVNLSVHHDNIQGSRTNLHQGYVEVTFAPFFCVYIPRETLDLAGLLDAKNGRHYRSDRLYCDVVREFAGKRMVYTPHAKLYHFLQQSTKQLKTGNAEDYQKIFVENTWDDKEKKMLGIK